MKYTFDTTYTEADVIRFNILAALYTDEGRTNTRNGRIAFTMLVLPISILLLSRGPASILPFAFGCGLMVMLIVQLIGMRHFNEKGIRDRMNALKKAGKLDPLPPSRMEFGEEWYSDFSEDSRHEDKYKHIHAIYADEIGSVYLFIFPTVALIIPAHCFTSDTQREEFISFIRSRCPDKPFRRVDITNHKVTKE